MKTGGVFELDCQAVNYEWGEKGNKSLIAQLLPANKIDASLPYAELWMGVHPNCPSRVKFGSHELLSTTLEKNPVLLGNYVRQRWGEIPFLLKVLSIAKPLSIQAHPDKKQAKELHNSDPEHYPDSNHKPELAIALSETKILYGFDRDFTVQTLIVKFPFLVHFLRTVKADIDPGSGNDSDQKLIELFDILLNLSQSQVSQLLERFKEQLESADRRDEKEKLFLSQYPKYPQDIGLLFVFLMRQLKLHPGDGVFLAPFNLHAYLQGNLTECMANSDNVIRAGMTNKFKDLNKLKGIIPFQDKKAGVLRGDSGSEYTKRYKTPAEEFELHEIHLPETKSLRYNNNGVPEILLNLSGTGKLEFAGQGIPLRKGTVLFVGADFDYSIVSDDDLHIIRGTVPLLKS